MADNKINLQKSLQARLEEWKNGEGILVHCCCAACATHCLSALHAYGVPLTLYYCNPNIDTKEEHDLRAAELIRFNEEAGYRYPVIVEPYAPQLFYDAVRGAEHAGEGSERCARCFRLRLSMSVAKAEALGLPYCLTTLSISPHKNAALLYNVGKACAADVRGVEFLPSDFKKDNGFSKSAALCAKYGIYRQNYCGCAFSKAERE